jgi:hypothetical protein
MKKPMEIFSPFWRLEEALKGENNILNTLISAFHATLCRRFSRSPVDHFHTPFSCKGFDFGISELRAVICLKDHWWANLCPNSIKVEDNFIGPLGL